MDLSNLYTGDCEIILYDNKWIYPIFKAGWTGLQRVKEDSRVNNEITGTAGNIFVHIRDPHKRFVGAINKYSQIHNKPIPDILERIQNNHLSDRHWLPQYNWLQHLSKYHDGDITLLDMHHLPFNSSVGEVPNKKPVQVLEHYVKADKILLTMCNTTTHIRNIIKEVNNVLS